MIEEALAKHGQTLGDLGPESTETGGNGVFEGIQELLNPNDGSFKHLKRQPCASAGDSAENFREAASRDVSE
jgi:hypothetical protein